jgi:hypothetical protein
VNIWLDEKIVGCRRAYKKRRVNHTGMLSRKLPVSQGKSDDG